MRASVIICSRNRAESLRRTLGSIAAAEHPREAWDVVVVDNGSSDDTPGVVASFAHSLPIQYVSEPEAGLSRARNRGVSVARGDYMVWTDDDVIVDRSWLVAYLDAFCARPGDALFAGQIRPVLEQPVTAWFAAGERHLADLMAVRAFSTVTPLSIDLLPYGANFAVRAMEQRLHLYDPNLGVAPGRRTGDEETTVARAILAGGGEGTTVPASIVNHVIPASRQTTRYVREYYAAYGENWPVVAPDKRRCLVGGVPPWVLRELIARKAAYIAKRLSGSDWLPDFVRHARLVGTWRRWRAFKAGEAAQRPKV